MKSEQIVAQQKRPDYLVLRGRGFEVLRGKPTIRQLPSMGVEVLCFAANSGVSHEKRGGEDCFRFSLTNTSGPVESIDAFTFRDAFLAVTTPAEAFELLSYGGRFRATRDEPNPVESILTWSEFQQWQRLIRIILTENFLHLGSFESPITRPFIWGSGEDGSVGSRSLPDEAKQLVWDVSKTTFDWLQGLVHSWQLVSDSDLTDANRRPRMRAEVSVSTVLEAMLASIYVETLSGVRYELCAFPDCNRVYEVQSNHKREYCSQACAHKASVRRRRTEAKAAEQEAKQKAAKRRLRKAKR